MDTPEMDTPEIDATELDTPQIPEEESNPDSHRFECRSCGFVYDPEEGVKKLGIEHPLQRLIRAAFAAPCAAAQWLHSVTSGPAISRVALRKISNLALALIRSPQARRMC